MTFKVTVTYQVRDNKVMTKEMTGVEKIERTWEKANGKNFEVLRVYERAHTWATWGIGSILHIDMTPEIKTA